MNLSGLKRLNAEAKGRDRLIRMAARMELAAALGSASEELLAVVAAARGVATMTGSRRAKYWLDLDKALAALDAKLGEL